MRCELAVSGECNRKRCEHFGGHDYYIRCDGEICRVTRKYVKCIEEANAVNKCLVCETHHGLAQLKGGRYICVICAVKIIDNTIKELHEANQ
jgi:hypothetical protein